VSVDPGSRGWSEHRHNGAVLDQGNQRINGDLAVSGDLTTDGWVIGSVGGVNSVIRSTSDSSVLATPVANHFGANITHDGANWVRIDTSRPALLFVIRDGGTVEGWTALPGPNPIAAWAKGQVMFGDVTKADTVWHEVGAAGEPPFQNGWTNYGSGFTGGGFRRMPDGTVHLRGLVRSGTMGAPIFTLPVGYRWDGATYCHLPVMSNNALASLLMNSNGELSLGTGSNVWVDLAAISFKAA
jgi:hypothetical protein